MKKLLLIIILFNTTKFAFSQYIRDIDSLLYVNENLKDTDTIKIDNLFEIAMDYYSFSPDSSLIYSLKAIELAKKISYIKGEANACKATGNAYFVKGDYENALYYYLQALPIYETINDIKNIGTINNNVGNIYWALQKYELALKNYYNAKYYFEKLKDQKRMSSAYMNLGAVYDQLTNLDSAFFYYNLSLEIKKELSDFDGAAGIYNNLGFMLLREKKYEVAILYFNDAIKIYEKEQNNLNLPIAYSNIAECYMETNRLNLAFICLQKGLSCSQTLGAIKQERDIMDGLYKYYVETGNTEKALEAHLLYIELKDSIFNEEINDELNDMQTKYETEKHQKEIELLQANQEKDKLTIQRQRLLVIAAIILMVSLVGFLVQTYKTSKQRKKAYKVLKLKNKEITKQREEILVQNLVLQQQKEEITTQNESLHQQKEEITAQRDEIELRNEELYEKNQKIEIQHKKIQDSITYASRIQSAILPKLDILQNNFSDYFILWKPRDIVSGDFYWFKHIENLIFIAAADCTGHGVPGAFMSMLGISYLNEIVTKRETKTANYILNQLRTLIKQSLNQTKQRGDNQDGMDIAFCAYDTISKKMQFSGANNPLWIINHSESENTESAENLKEIKPDRIPIGVHPRDNQEFTLNEIQLQKGDLFYLFSDGYESQFGGDKNETFKSRRFQETLQKNFTKSLTDQKSELESELNNWKGKQEQIDDILVIGIKV